MPEYVVRATNLPTTPMVRAYLECAEWSGVADEAFEDAKAPHWDSSAIDAAYQDCLGFVTEIERTGLAQRLPDHYTKEQLGHDFWLSRNGHGAGFFDRGLGEAGDLLHAAARVWGEVFVDYDEENETLYLS